MNIVTLEQMTIKTYLEHQLMGCNHNNDQELVKALYNWHQKELKQNTFVGLGDTVTTEPKSDLFYGNGSFNAYESLVEEMFNNFSDNVSDKIDPYAIACCFRDIADLVFSEYYDNQFND